MDGLRFELEPPLLTGGDVAAGDLDGGSFDVALDAAAEAFGAADALRRERVAVPGVLLAAAAAAAGTDERLTGLLDVTAPRAAPRGSDGPVPVDELRDDLAELVGVLVRPEEHAVREPVEDASGERLDVPDVAELERLVEDGLSCSHNAPAGRRRLR